MSRYRMLMTGGVLLFLVMLGGWRSIVDAEPTAQLLSGALWQQMSHEARVAYIWGMGNLLEFEGALKEPAQAGRKSFVPILIQGLRGQPMKEIVRQIDTYYQANPQQLQQPVVEVLFREVVFPAVKTTQRGGRVQ